VIELPLFPLSSVLLPCGRLPLQIFEQRYLDLVRSCLKEDTGFGLVWILEGAEVAGPGRGQPQLARVGTHARIVDWDALPNNLLGVTIEGGERFELHDSWAQDNQLVVGHVELEATRPPQVIREEWDSLLEVLVSLEQHPHVKNLGIHADHSDAWQVGSVLAQLLPVEESYKYELLATDDIGSFMEQLDGLLSELGELEA
jgi:Lon protease-like protein